jgi:hypothetical protein
VLKLDFVRTARAKGLSEDAVLFRHALKVAILPVIGYSGPAAAGILTGSIVIETLFGIPGIGPFFVNSALNFDPFMTSGVVARLQFVPHSLQPAGRHPLFRGRPPRETRMKTLGLFFNVVRRDPFLIVCGFFS